LAKIDGGNGLTGGRRRAIGAFLWFHVGCRIPAGGILTTHIDIVTVLGDHSVRYAVSAEMPIGRAGAARRDASQSRKKVQQPIPVSRGRISAGTA
jgi:hypothetical protein